LIACRKPANTSPDDEEDDDVINGDVSGEENADDEGDDDLSGLNSSSLQKKISSEVKSLVPLFICTIDAKYIVIQRPQWKKLPVQSAAATYQDPADLFANDDDLDVNIPNVGHEAGTTASEFDGALDDEPEDEDKPVEAIEVDESDEDSEPQHKKTSKKVCSRFLLPIAPPTKRLL
jgi:hypothetical protein